MNIFKEVQKIVEESSKLELETKISEKDKQTISKWIAKLAVTVYREGMKKGE